MDPNQCQMKIFEKRTAKIEETMSIRRSNQEQPRLLTSDPIQQCSSSKVGKGKHSEGSKKLKEKWVVEEKKKMVPKEECKKCRGEIRTTPLMHIIYLHIG